MKFAFAVVIELNGTYSDNPALGLINNELRWITQDASNTTDTYYSGILDGNWISRFNKRMDLRRMGSPAATGGANLVIGNTFKEWKSFETLDINFQGLKCTIYDFDLDIAHGGTNANRGKVFTSVCAGPTYSKTNFNIPIRDAYEERNTNINTVVSENTELDANGESIVQGSSNGKIIPATFGVHEKAKLIRVANKSETVASTTETSPEGLSVFPVYAHVDFGFYVPLSNSVVTDITWLTDLVSEGVLYAKVIKGAAQGEIRLVTEITIQDIPLSGGVFKAGRVVIAEQFKTTLSDNTGVNEDYDAEEQSWVSFVTVYRNYRSDIWPGKDFLDESLNAVGNGPPIFDEDGGVFKEAGSFTLDAAGTDANEIGFNPAFFESNLDDVVGYEVIVPAEIERDLGTDSSKWAPLEFLTASGDAIWYSSAIAPTLDSESSNILGPLTDRLESTSYDLKFTTNDTNDFIDQYAIPFVFKFPELDSFEFDEVFLCLDIEVSGDPSEWRVVKYKMQSRGWIGPDENHYGTDFGSTLGADRKFFAIPDFWYTDADTDSFYPNKVTDTLVTGQENFKLNFTEISEINSVEEFGLILEFKADKENYFEIKLRQASLVFRKTANVKDEIYTPLDGRIWSEPNTPTGKTASESIDGPIDVFQHAKSLQNWSMEGAPTPANGWGKGYADPANVLINSTSNAVGSIVHDDLDIQGADSVSTARQLLEDNDGNTREITKSLCRGFWLAAWVNNQGEECLGQFTRKTSLALSQTITLNDIIPGSVGNIQEPDSRYMYSKPFVNYGKDGAGNFSGSIKITRTDENLTVNQDKIDAVSGDISWFAKIRLWNQGREVYLKYGSTNTPPRELTDLDWISDAPGAVWYLKQWFESMGVISVDGALDYTTAPRNYLSLSVPYTISRDWDLGTRFKVNFPSQTDGQDREAMVVSITPLLVGATPSKAVEVLLYDAQTAFNNTIFDSYASSTEWQDTYASGTQKDDYYG